MSKVFRYGVRILAAFLLLWLVLGIGAWIYLQTHRAELTAKVNSFLNSRFLGNIHIRDVSANLWNHFPYPALQVNGVTIDDSVYARTGQHTLYLERVRIIPGFSGLFGGHFSIRRVVLEKGSLYLFRDSSGYSNGYVWSGRQNNPEPAQASASSSSLPLQVQLDDIHISIADSNKHKAYDFQVHHLSMIQEDPLMQGDRVNQGDPPVQKDSLLQRDSLIREKPRDADTVNAFGGNRWRTRLEVTVRSLAFNTRKGSYLRDQEVRGKGVLDFSIGKRLLSFQGLALDIGRQNILADGAFYFDTSNQFKLHIDAPSLDFGAGRSWMPFSISRKLDSLQFERPFAVDARLEGKLSGGGEPRMMVRWIVRKNVLSGYIGTIHNCSFSGYLTNTVDPMLPPSDANSLICADSLEGKYENSIAFHTRRLEIRRLDSAMMVFDVAVHNDIAPWQDLIQSEDLSFDKGKVDMSLSCSFPLTEGMGVVPEFNGSFSIRDAGITYLPRHVKITDGQVQLAFDHHDLLIRQISGKIGKSPIMLSGSARNFLALANTDTSKMVLDWKLHSSSLDLETLLPFLGKGSSRRNSEKSRGSVSSGDSRNRSGLPGSIIDRYIKRCKVRTQLEVDRLTYQNFTAERVNALLLLSNGVFSLSGANLQTAKGNISLSGTLSSEGEEENKVVLDATLVHLDLPTLFYAFDDFGQQSLKSHNLAGALNARASFSMLLTNKGKKVPGSLDGSLDFSIDQGALLNFSPLTKLSNFALKKRDLSHVYFSQLHDIFEFSKDTVLIKKMEIQSSVLEMFVEGSYKLDGAYTNADIQIPFNNLKKRKGIPENVGVDTKHGLSIFVHAYNTGSEPLRYKFGLFKKKTKSDSSAMRETR